MNASSKADSQTESKTDKSHDWWRGAIIYQIYPRSFRDSNADGIGDIQGITEKLEYIADLGVDAIWLSPFFKSPMKDFGYDISDYRDVDPIFGNLDDFKELIKKAHLLNMKVIIDQVLSHTSDQHSWFTESRSDKSNEKANWYVWADPKTDGSVPNNWQSVFGGSAWQWDSRRKQYYLHNFLSTQPDLNFHHPQVQDAVLDAVKFWLELGVDGFRLDVVNFYFHNQNLHDNPALEREAGHDTYQAINPYSYQSHLFDKSQPEMPAFLMKLRRLLDEYDAITSLGEIGDEERSLELLAQYTGGGDKLHMAYTFDLLSSELSSAHIYKVIETFEKHVSDGWACWSIGNHDVERVITRWGSSDVAIDFAKLPLVIQLSLRGSYCIYQGEELGLTQASLPYEKLQDPFGIAFWPEIAGRDGCRTPLPWCSDELNYGFSSSTEPWLPLATEHGPQAVNLQQNNPDSVLHHYRRFIHWWKNHPVLRLGNIRMINNLPDGIIGLQRYDENSTMVCFFNISDNVQITDWSFGMPQPLLEDFFPAAKIVEDRLHLPAYHAYFAYVR